MKKLLCALLICALCAGALTACKRQNAPESAGEEDRAPARADAGDQPTPVPEEGGHGEEDQSAALAEMPTLAPAETVPGDEAISSAEVPAADGSDDDYYSIDDLIARTEEFDTYDEQAAPTPQVATGVIDPNTVPFSAFEDSDLGFTFNYPSGWVNVPGIYTICYREMVEPGDFPARVAISAKRLVHSPEGTVLTDELTSFVRTIYKQYDADTFQLGTLNSQDTFLGKQAYSNTYLAYSGETEVKGFIIGCAIGRVLFVFHFCASYDDYIAMEGVMRYMLKSVQLLQQEE